MQKCRPVAKIMCCRKNLKKLVGNWFKMDPVNSRHKTVPRKLPPGFDSRSRNRVIESVSSPRGQVRVK